MDVPPDHPEAAEWIGAEAAAAAGFVEARYDAEGRRWEPRLRLLPPGQEAETKLPLGPADVLLVTGGGKGIAAECALALARETGVRLALMGRSNPDADAELAANLDRMAAAGVAFRYLRADVTDARAVREAVREAQTHLGNITAVLHGAGANIPHLLSSLDEADFARTLAPKVAGAENVLAAIDPDRLRLFVAFGSIIARTGMRGEADYALANEWLARRTERFAAEHPRCRCLAVEWSVWSGVGMGERLGRVDALARAGITPIPPDAGVRLLRDLLARPPAAVSVVVAGRFGEPPTLQIEQPELPLRRFLERPRIHYPGVELVVDADLSPRTDPYLDDHIVAGQRLFPAVLGLEAMAQAAMALAQTSELPVFEQVAFQRPIVVPEDAPVTLRVAALVREPGRVEVAVRSAETAFQADHFRAICRFADHEGAASGAPTDLPDGEPVDLDPDRDLYGHILFHRGRFRRLRGYRRLRATECVAEIGGDGAAPAWFGRYLPADLVLGDPAARDAAVHAVQSCLPHRTLLPVGVDRLEICGAGDNTRFVHARERSRDGDLFVYDLDVTGADGSLCERWEGLRLRAVQATAFPAVWPEPLLGPYIERRIPELIPGAAIGVAVRRNGAAERRRQSDQAIGEALGNTVLVHRRPDGRPEVSGAEVSAAHAGDLTLAVAGPGPLGCDVEPVAARSAGVWRDLLGPERWALAEIVARETGEDADTAATRVWTAVECLKKAGAAMDAPLTLAASSPVGSAAVGSAAGGWLLLASGSLRLASLVTAVRGASERLAFAALARGGDAGL